MSIETPKYREFELAPVDETELTQEQVRRRLAQLIDELKDSHYFDPLVRELENELDDIDAQTDVA